MIHIHQKSATRWLVLVCFMLLINACSISSHDTATPEIPANSCLVDSSYSSQPINPLVYGVNHGPWAVVTEKTLPFAVDAGISIIRFPGGNWGDENDLQEYHIDQFVSLADQMGSEVFINVRLAKGTPEKAAELVRYANIEKGYGIKYWGIGNEPTLFATAKDDPNYGVEKFNDEWRAIAEAMKAVDDSILLIGPELHQFGPDLESTPKDPFGLDWMTEFLKANGDLVDMVSIHRYPFPQGQGGRAATIEELVAASQEWDTIIPYLRNLIIETTGEDLPIAVTEVNSHWSNAVGGEATPDSYINAIWWADALGRMITNQVTMVNYFSLHSNNSIGGYGLLSRSEPRPTYYVYQIYKNFGENLVYAGCHDPNLRIYAATNSDDTLSVILINLGQDTKTTRLLVENPPSHPITATQFDEINLLHPLDSNMPLSLENIDIPAYSILLLEWK